MPRRSAALAAPAYLVIYEFGPSAMLTVLVLFVFPLWAIAVLTIDVMVLFGLLTQSDEFLA